MLTLSTKFLALKCQANVKQTKLTKCLSKTKQKSQTSTNACFV